MCSLNVDRQPHLYLLFSVDIVDSTKLKYQKGKDWYKIIKSFYSEFTDSFEKQIKNTLIYYKLPEKEVSVWKYAGDEILFYIDITLKDEVPVAIKAFSKVLEGWHNPQKRKAINLKGTAWLAQVPFIDRKFDDKSGKIDFIGPSIDCGFRIAKFATGHKLVLSIDVVSLCYKFSDLRNSFYYSGTESLKGIDWATNYPVFFLVIGNDRTLEEKYFSTCCQESNMATYLDEFFKQKEKETEYIIRINPDIPSYLKSKYDISLEATKNDDDTPLISDGHFADSISLSDSDNFAEAEKEVSNYKH